jgi:hypothetical protein
MSPLRYFARQCRNFVCSLTPAAAGSRKANPCALPVSVVSRLTVSEFRYVRNARKDLK